MKFTNFSTELWPLIDVKLSIFLNVFRNNEWILIKFCLCIDIYVIHVVTNTHYFPKSWPLIDFRIMFMLSILWSNWWIWSNLIDTCTLIFLCQNMCNNKNKHSGGVSCTACNAFILLENVKIFGQLTKKECWPFNPNILTWLPYLFFFIC